MVTAAAAASACLEQHDDIRGAGPGAPGRAPRAGGWAAYLRGPAAWATLAPRRDCRARAPALAPAAANAGPGPAESARDMIIPTVIR